MKLGIRGMAIRYPGWFTLLFLVLLCAGAYGNVKVFDLRGGILDDALPENDPYRVMDKEARKDGFNPQEIIPIIIKFPDGLTSENLRKVVDVTNMLRSFGDGGVLSLSTTPQYQDTEDALLDRPYLTEEKLRQLDISLFNERVASDASVEGLLLSRDRSFAPIVRFLPPGYDEPKEGWRIVELFEGNSLSWWKRLIKADIYPRDPAVSPGGWIIGRWQIDQGLNRDMILLPALGVAISFPIFWYFLSLRQAAIATFVTLLAGIWFVRAAIYPLHAIYPLFHERVYTILAYANVIVQGTSFALHKFNVFREAKGNTTRERFLDARSGDGALGMIAFVAIFSFLSLNTFVVWQMREMGWQSIIGVLAVLAGTTVFLPALYMTLEKIFGAEDLEKLPGEKKRGYNIRCHFGRWLAHRKIKVSAALLFPLGMFALACFLFSTGKIETRTKPWDYIRGTLVERTFQSMKNSGNEYLDILVRPADGGVVYRQAFIKEAWLFECAIRSCNGSQDSRFKRWQEKKGFEFLVGFKEAGSVLGKVRQISRESYKKFLPSSDEEVDDIFFLLDSSPLDAEVKRQMWFRGGIRVIASAVIDDSAELRILIERMLAFAKEEFPTLTISVFGKIPTYPQLDRYITAGEASNIFFSFLSTFVIYFAWITYEKRKIGRPEVNAAFIAGVMLFPFFFAVGNMGALMWWRKIPLSMSTAPIFDLAVNAASDFSPYIIAAFIMNLRIVNVKDAVRRALFVAGAIVALDCLLNLVTFFPLWFSAFQPVRELGWIMWFMLLSCAVGALGFIPALLPYCVREQQMEVNHEKHFWFAVHYWFSIPFLSRAVFCHHRSRSDGGGNREHQRTAREDGGGERSHDVSGKED